MGLKNITLGICLGFLIGCGTVAFFPYRFYVLDSVSYDGTLRGPDKDGSKDLSLDKCKPDLQDPNHPEIEPNKAKCVVMLTLEFKQLKDDKESCDQKLSDCQKGMCGSKNEK